ncbi:MAG: PAS domain S-box protein [Burkholderiales bacterium]
MKCDSRNLLVFAVASFAAAVLGNGLAIQHGLNVAIAFSGGILLAVLSLSEQRCWWRWMLVALAADCAAGAWFGQFGVAHVIVDALGHAAGVLAAAWLVRRLCGSPFHFDTTRNVLALVVSAFMPGAAISASVEIALAALAGQAAGGMAWMIHCTGYALGSLIAAPLTFAVFQSRAEPMSMSGARWAEATLLTLALVALGHVVFSSQLYLVFLLLPPLLWAGLRFGMLVAVIELIVLAMMTLYATVSGHGPYISGALSPAESLLMAQSFLVLASAATMLLVAVTSQRRLAQAELRRAHDELEARVIARTAALRESEQRLRTLLDAIPDQVRLKDAQGRYVMLNRAAQRGFGVPEGQILGKTVFELRSADIAANIDAEDRQAIAAQGSMRIERPSYFHGTWREIIAAPIRDDAGMVTGLVSISRDITERKQMEIALRESEQRLRALLDAIPDRVRLKDVDGRYLMVNRAARGRLGLPEERLIGKTVFDLWPADEAARIDAEEKRAIKSAHPIRVERNAYMQEAGWREAILTPIRNDAGVVTGLLSISRDITERKNAELEKLREREERYRMLVEYASDVIYRTDPKGNFTYFNSDAALRAAGYSRDELLGRHYLDLVHPDYRAQAEAFYSRQFRERATASYYEFPVLTKDGRTIWVGQQVNVILENNRIVFHQAVCRDISDRVAAQQALRETNEKLRQLSSRQEALVEAERTRIAHDLHDGIGQSLHLARIKIESTMAVPGAHAVAPNLREITRIIDDTNAAIRTLEFDLSPPMLRELGLGPALDWLADDMQQQYGLQVRLSNDGEATPLPQLSGAIAFRLVRELLINVIRHAGVRQAHVDKQRAGMQMIITVSDEGAGFDANVVPPGLGLTSVRERIESVGGQLIVSSSRGEGTVVTLTMPLSPDDSREVAAG